MKINLENKNDSINISELTSSHIIVGIHRDNPVILTSSGFMRAEYSFRCLNNLFTSGNAYIGGTTVQEALHGMAVHSESRFEAFTNWREALRWLIDNAPAI